MAENYIEAENDYMLGMKYKDIAEKYGVTINTVKSWKQRYGWEKVKEGSHTKDKKVCTQKKKGVHTKKEIAPVQPEAEEKETNSGGLSEKRQLFCLYFAKYRNKVKAYQKAFGCSYETACGHASELWKNVEIQKEINRIMEEVRNEIKIDIKDLLQQQIDIARADINDYVDISTGHVRVQNNFDGTIVKEIKDTKEGISIKLYDKQKAIEFIKNNLPDGSQEKNANNMLALAEILKCPVENRNIEDLEEKDESASTIQQTTI